jgi:hypothetical protein
MRVLRIEAIGRPTKDRGRGATQRRTDLFVVRLRAYVLSAAVAATVVGSALVPGIAAAAPTANGNIQAGTTCTLKMEPMSIQLAAVRAKSSSATRARLYLCDDGATDFQKYRSFIQPMNDDDSMSYQILVLTIVGNDPPTVSESGFWAWSNDYGTSWVSDYTGTAIVQWMYDTPDHQHVVSTKVANTYQP